MTWKMPRESVELVGPIVVAVDDTTVSVFEVALIPVGARPIATDWSAPVTVEEQKWLLVGPGTTRPLTPGSYQLWVRYVDSPETPVLNKAGHVRIE